MDFQLLFQTLGAVLIGSGAIVYLLRKLFEHLLRRDLKEFEANLKSKHDIEIERLRSDLRITAFEYETRFAKLHEKRAQVIAELYTKLVRAYKSVASIIAPLQLADERSQDERLKIAAQDTNEFTSYLNENLIYFDENLVEKIAAFSSRLNEVCIDLINFKTYPPIIEATDKEEKKRLELFHEAWESLNSSVTIIKKEIENSLRSMIGYKKK